jgi:hypothetical protein
MSKGGTTSGSTEIPAWLEDAAIENINKARDVSQIGYVPYYGPDVAAFSPMQQQSMQSTGNAASAFGLAPQGFNAMAGMPQAETFAGGLQGYSSAPLYEQSLDKLFANAPAQYRALNQQFIDPFTGARPRSGYGATPMQVSQMASGGGGGGVDSTGPVGRDSNNYGEYFGVNSEYNPYKYSMPTKDISGDGVIDYRDMSFGEAGRRDIGFGEKIGNLIKGVTGISAIEGMIDYGQGIADGFTPSPFEHGLFSQSMKSSMTPEESMRIINEGAARYNRLRTDRGFDPNSLSNELIGAVTTPLEPANIINGNGYYGSGDQYAQSRIAVQEAQRQQLAQARQEADIQVAAERAQSALAVQYANKQAAAKERMAIEQAAQLAHDQAIAATRNTVNDGPQWSPSPYSGYSKPNENEGGRPTQSQSPF